MNDELSKLRLNNQMLESNNRLLVKKLKEKEKDIRTINNLYNQNKSKLNEIYRVVSSEKINEENYIKLINWIKSYIEN